jgi:hypothetical protein
MKSKKHARRKSHRERRLRNRLRRQQAMNETIEPARGGDFVSDPVEDPGTHYWERRLPVMVWMAIATIAVAALAALVLK